MFGLSYTCITAIVAIVAFVSMIRYASMAMNISWGISETSEGSGVVGSSSFTAVGNDVISATITVAHSVTNQENDLAFNTGTDKLQAIVIVSTQDVTMYTNHASGSSPDDTILLKAGIPLEWHKNSGVTCPIAGATGAVTKLFFTNAGGTSAFDATVKIRGVQKV